MCCFILSMRANAVERIGMRLDSQQIDSTRMAELDKMLDTYFAAMATEDIKTKNAEVDFLISSCEDESIRQHVALYCYTHYLESKLMGDEAVAIHLTDTWFVPGKIAMIGEMDLLNAMVYAEFNRQSQIGENAPELSVQTLEGDTVSLLGKGSRRLSILYFYDTGCAKCKLETPLLVRALNNSDYPIDLIAFCTGANKELWKEYSEKFDISVENTRVINCWDPERTSDFERKYGVLQTPRMLLIGRDGRIIGRGLDTEALITLLKNEYITKDYPFGEDKASVDFFDSMLDGNGDNLLTIADELAASTLSKKDTTMFKQVAGDLLYYLTNQRDENIRNNTKAFIKKYITDAPGIWLDPWDSLKVVGLGEMMEGMLSKGEVGSKVSKIKVPGTMLSGKGSKTKSNWKLHKLGGDPSYVIFHTTGCSVCQQEIKAATELMSLPENQGQNIRILEVNMDEISDKNPDLMIKLFDSFDMSVMPLMMEVDKKGIIRRRYMSLIEN